MTIQVVSSLTPDSSVYLTKRINSLPRSGIVIIGVAVLAFSISVFVVLPISCYVAKKHNKCCWKENPSVEKSDPSLKYKSQPEEFPKAIK
jgi:hypothetical protein